MKTPKKVTEWPKLKEAIGCKSCTDFAQLPGNTTPFNRYPSSYSSARTAHEDTLAEKYSLDRSDPQKLDQAARQRDAEQKRKMKRQADSHGTMKKVELQVGDIVPVKRDGHVTKNQTPYDIMPYTIIKGTMVTATRPDHTITRSISHFEALKKPPFINLYYQSGDGDDNVTESHHNLKQMCQIRQHWERSQFQDKIHPVHTIHQRI